MENNELLKNITFLGGVPFIIALVQMVKPFVSDTRWYPIIAIAFGLAINLIATWALGLQSRLDLVIALFQGLLSGLAAAGLYSTVDTIREGALADKNKRNA